MVHQMHELCRHVRTLRPADAVKSLSDGGPIRQVFEPSNLEVAARLVKDPKTLSDVMLAIGRKLHEAACQV